MWLIGVEQYLLAVRGRTVFVALHREARDADIFKAMYQAEIARWLRSRNPLQDEESLIRASYEQAADSVAFESAAIAAGWNTKHLLVAPSEWRSSWS